MARSFKNPGAKKKLFSPTLQLKIKNLIVIGDFFSCDQQQIRRLFSVFPYADFQSLFQNTSNTRQNSPAKNSKPALPSEKQRPLFLYLDDHRHKPQKNYTAGKPNAYLAKRSYLYFLKAVEAVQKIKNASLVTLPVSKEWIIRSGKKFQGHTEELERLFKVKTVMCMYHPELSIIPLTNHIPLKSVSEQIKKINAAAFGKAILFFLKLTKAKKAIALTGLNPHAGENGKIGTEESHLKKLIASFKKKGLAIAGPLAADGLFMPQNRSRYSLVIAAYHDQALIPFKTLYGTEGLNITLNLPVLRVSPDHGPAYEIAGKNDAQIQSVYQSLVFSMETGEKWIKQYSSP